MIGLRWYVNDCWPFPTHFSSSWAWASIWPCRILMALWSYLEAPKIVDTWQYCTSQSVEPIYTTDKYALACSHFKLQHQGNPSHTCSLSSNVARLRRFDTNGDCIPNGDVETDTKSFPCRVWPSETNPWWFSCQGSATFPDSCFLSADP